MSRRIWASGASVFILLLAGVSQASVTITGIEGTFANPTKSGNVLNPNGTVTFFDNSASAEVGFEALDHVVRWGNITPTPGFGTSALGFIPASSPGTVVDGQEFLLGTILYANGSSELDKLIFGIDLNITISDSAGGPVDPFTANFEIFTTLNGFGDAWDADFVQINGLPSTTTLHAFEGKLVSANLYGAIFGDPMLQFTRFELQPGQEQNGFIGNGPLQAPIPEPSAILGWTLLGLSFGSGELIRRRRCKK